MDLMRQLEARHKSLWDNLSRPTPEMVAASDCDPALLSGWTDRDISLWDVGAVNGKPGLQEILVALCYRKKNWDKISYLRFPKETVSSAGLNLTASNGKTGDPRVDNSHTHFEIKGITGKELCALLFQVSSGKFATGEFTKKELDKILYDSYCSMKTRSVVQSTTSQTLHIDLPSSGTEEQAVTTEVAPEQAVGETPTTDQMPRPSSSTTSDVNGDGSI
jgi:hypothetical protein